MSAVAIPMIAGLGTTELLIILGVLILLFGAKKLPELARGSGRALRIFKSETKGLMDDDENDGDKTPEQREIDAREREDREREDRRAAENPVEQHHPDTDR